MCTPLSRLVHTGCTLCQLFIWRHCIKRKRTNDLKFVRETYRENHNIMSVAKTIYIRYFLVGIASTACIYFTWKHIKQYKRKRKRHFSPSYCFRNTYQTLRRASAKWHKLCIEQIKLNLFLDASNSKLLFYSRKMDFFFKNIGRTFVKIYWYLALAIKSFMIYSTANENHNEIDVHSMFTIQSYVRIDRFGIDYQSVIDQSNQFIHLPIIQSFKSFILLYRSIHSTKYEIEKRTKFTKVHKVSDAFSLFIYSIYLFIYLINAIISYILIVPIGEVKFNTPKDILGVLNLCPWGY